MPTASHVEHCRRKTRHTTHLDGFPSKVTIIKNRHPLQGKSLDVLTWLHRNGILHLTLVLPDGSRSFIPAAWTNLNEICPQKFKSPNSPPTTDLIASTSNLLHARKIVDVLLGKLYSSEKKFNNALKEEHNCAKTTKTLARAGRTTTNSRDLDNPQPSTAKRDHNRSGTPNQQKGLPGENKPYQGEKS